ESVSIRTSPNGEKPAISNATMLPAISRVASLRQRVTASTHPSNPASAIKFDGKRKNPAIFDAMKNIPARLMAGLFAPKHREHDIGRVFDQRQQRTGGTARRALALLPVADGFDRHAEPVGKFGLRETGAGTQILDAQR